MGFLAGSPPCRHSHPSTGEIAELFHGLSESFLRPSGSGSLLSEDLGTHLRVLDGRMDEDSLEMALQTYHVQLQQVELAMGTGLEASEQADLHQLQGDLKELIKLTEASLVSVRKSKLLATLDQEHLAQEDTEYLALQKTISEVVEVPEAPGAELETVSKGEAGPEPNNPGQEEEEGGDDEEEELSGTKVNAPYYSPWGTLEYHNAMIVGTEQAEDGSAAVRVLYLYPTHKSLKPCPFFLEGKCRFKENCSRPHPLGWQTCSLSCPTPDVDSGFYTVKFDSLLLKEVVLEGDSVLPPLRMEPTESSDSDGGDGDNSSYARGVVASGGRVGVEHSCHSSQVCPQHMSRAEECPGNGDGVGAGAGAAQEVDAQEVTAGHGGGCIVLGEPGKGLGRYAQGRVEPIHTVVLPRGKSLDQCAEALQRRVKGGKGVTHRPPKCRGKGATHAGRPPPRDVFDFLNEKLQTQAPGALEVGAGPPGARRGKEAYHASKSTKRALSLRLVQTEEQIGQTQKDIRGIQEALARNAGQHSVVAAQLQEKLAGAQQQLRQLRAQEAGLQREQRKADTHKKMTEF
nr:zinc finger CCCH-type with G patch domain-containing protein [Loxodonta africana]